MKIFSLANSFFTWTFFTCYLKTISHQGRAAAQQQQQYPSEPNPRDSTQPSSRTNTGSRSRSKHTSPDLQRHRASLQPSVNVMSSWETLVLFAINLSRLDVEVNMSNVMGHTMWVPRNLLSWYDLCCWLSVKDNQPFFLGWKRKKVTPQKNKNKKTPKKLKGGRDIALLVRCRVGFAAVAVSTSCVARDFPSRVSF